MGFLDAIKKVPFVGGIVSVAEGAVNIVSVAIKILNGIIKTFDKFPMNLICGVFVFLLTIVYEIMKIGFDMGPDEPPYRPFANLAVFIIYIIPYILRAFYIFIRYVNFVVMTAIAKHFDPEMSYEDGGESKARVSSNYRKFLIYIQTCHPDPRQWYTYPQNHNGNTHQVRMGFACMNPCGSKYVPYLGGLLCKKADGRFPRYCPQAVIMRAFEGLPVDGSKNFSIKGFEEKCKEQTIPWTSFEKKFGAFETANEVLTRGVCQQTRALIDRPQEVAHACHASYCKRGDRQPFCSRMDPVYENLVDNGPAQLLKIPGLILMGAFLLQVARFLMYDEQQKLVESEQIAFAKKTIVRPDQ